MMVYVIAAALLLATGVFSIQAISANIRKEAKAKMYWLVATACFAALIVSFLVIRFF